MVKASQGLPEVEPDQQAQFSQLRLVLTDEVQERYEVARPLLLQQPVTAAQRSRETGTNARTIRRYVRRFAREGMRGLFDERALIVRGHSVPDEVRFEVIRLKTLYPPLHLREISNILFARLGCRIDHKTVSQILRSSGVLDQQRLPLTVTRFHDHSDPKTARLEVIKLYYQGWNIKSPPEGHPLASWECPGSTSTISSSALKRNSWPRLCLGLAHPITRAVSCICRC